MNLNPYEADMESSIGHNRAFLVETSLKEVHFDLLWPIRTLDRESVFS